MWGNKLVSVILPAYNEEKNIATAVADFLKTGVVDELIVVDNNSTDRTSQLAKESGAIVVQEKRQGYGFALRYGLTVATGSFVILAEPDGTFEGKDVMRLLEKAKNFDLVLGTRTNVKYIKKGANMGLLLRWGNILMAKFLQILFFTQTLTDCGCTFRLIRKEILGKILPEMTVSGAHLLPEMVILAKKEKARMTEIPVSYGPRIGFSKITGSLLKAVRVGLSMFFLILRYRFKFLLFSLPLNF